MVRHGKTMCVIVCHVIFPMWMARLTNPWSLYLLVYGVCYVGTPHELPLCWFVIGVKRWHMACLTLLLDKVSVGKWFCLQHTQ
jgi:hypothetical protein